VCLANNRGPDPYNNLGYVKSAYNNILDFKSAYNNLGFVKSADNNILHLITLKQHSTFFRGYV
jgi:hypothetical protein